jgi:hypothetical protein
MAEEALEDSAGGFYASLQPRARVAISLRLPSDIKNALQTAQEAGRSASMRLVKGPGAAMQVGPGATASQPFPPARPMTCCRSHRQY